MKAGNLARISSLVVALSQIAGLASCSKKTPEAEHAGESRDRTGKAAITPAAATETDSEKNKSLPSTKAAERHATVEEQRLQAVARQLDDIELQRKRLGQEEEKKRVILNQLRGLPGQTPIDISKPRAAKIGEREAIEGEQSALDAYLLVALELETLEAKAKIHSEQMARLHAEKNQPPAKSTDANPE